MFDQLTIGNISSYDDYEASVKEREIGEPKKKSIKETIPFSNQTYDFSAINGEVYWEERTLKYVFEILADSAEEMEEKKCAFKSWIMNVMQEELHDPFIPFYHFIATFDDISCDDTEVEKTTITVTFTAYPYMISDSKRICEFALSAGEEVSAKIFNNSSHKITPTIKSDVALALTMDGVIYEISAGETKDHSFKLSAGVNTMVLRAASKGTVKIEFWEEVF